jgi:hypothetical protein
LPGWEQGYRKLQSHTVIKQTKQDASFASYSIGQQIKSCLLKWTQNCSHLPGVVSKKTIVEVLEMIQRQDLVEEIETEIETREYDQTTCIVGVWFRHSSLIQIVSMQIAKKDSVRQQSKGFN